MMNNTLKKFNYPDGIIKEYNYWVLLVRPVQITLGDLVLVYKDTVVRFADVSENGIKELKAIIGDVEEKLFNLFNYDKINYLMLMMEDNEVHYHIIPRYRGDVFFNNIRFCDTGWKGIPDFSYINKLKPIDFFNLKEVIKGKFNENIIDKFEIVYTTGAFDPFHHGHLNILRNAKKIAKKLIVGVSTDELILKDKFRQSFIPFEKRKDILASIKFVDIVIPQVDKNKQKIVDKYNVDAIVVGSDWKGRYPKTSCPIIYFDYTEGISSTLMRGWENEK